jgi:hypothetical protein
LDALVHAVVAMRPSMAAAGRANEDIGGLDVADDGGTMTIDARCASR